MEAPPSDCQVAVANARRTKGTRLRASWPRSRSTRFSAPALALLRGLRLTAARFISSAGALDKKAVDAIVLRLIDKLVARELAKDLEVGDGSRIGCKDLKRPALRDLGNGFLRFEDWQRAVQTPRVERLFWHQMVSARREDLRFVYGNLDGVSSSQGLCTIAVSDGSGWLRNSGWCSPEPLRAVLAGALESSAMSVEALSSLSRTALPTQSKDCNRRGEAQIS